jgi:hypothetical protein
MQVTIEGTPSEVRAQILELAEMMRTDDQITIDGGPVADKIMAGLASDARARATQDAATKKLVLVIDDDGIRTSMDSWASDEDRASVASAWYSVLRDPCMELVETGRASVEFVERLVKSRAQALIDLGWSAVELLSPGPGTQGWTTLIDLRAAATD